MEVTDNFLGVDDSDVDSICLNCGREEKIPDFIYDEMGHLTLHKELGNKKAYSLYCNNCRKLKVVSKSYLENKDD